MQYKALGKTGKHVSVIGFGGMRFKAEEYKAGNLDACANIVLRARELGINYFDTAPGYCDDMSEKIYGHAFQQMKDRPLVSTKCGHWMAKNADEARAKIENSLRVMHLEKIDFYNMWCIKTMDEYRAMVKKGGIYDGILKAKEEGLISHICISVHIDGKGVAEIVNDGRVEVVTLGYNALNFAYRRAGVQACHKAGVGVVTMNPLGGGIIPQHGALFDFIKSTPEESILEAALRFLIGQPEINVALAGIPSIAALEECVRAADNITPVTEETLARMTLALSDNLNNLCTGCAYCDECPEGVPIPKLLDSYNQVLLPGGDLEKAKGRLSDHWCITGEPAKACTQCGHCESLCTQKLPIMERLRELAGLV